MTYLISCGSSSRVTHGRDIPNDALQFAYALERIGETKIKITNSETGAVYNIPQFERLIQGVRAG